MSYDRKGGSVSEQRRDIISLRQSLDDAASGIVRLIAQRIRIAPAMTETRIT